MLIKKDLRKDTRDQRLKQKWILKRKITIKISFNNENKVKLLIKLFAILKF